MKDNSKAVVAHAGGRDYYQLSLALQEINSLDYLVTDYYSPKLLGILHQKFRNRMAEGLPFSKSINLCSTLFINDNEIKDALLSKKAFEIAKNNNSHLFLYSYYAYEAFKLSLEKKLPSKRILFQLHPHPLPIKRIFEDEINIVPNAKISLNNEKEMHISDELLYKLSNESKMADHIVVASTFTKETLIENGVLEKNITIIPYGVNSESFPFKERNFNLNIRPLRVLFVGQMIQRKGISYLFDAIENLSKIRKVELTLCGRGFFDDELLATYSKNNIFIKKNLSHNQLLFELHRNDIMVLPSLVEGFGLVILEAMSTGLPVIATKNTGGFDVIESNIDGFIIPIRDSNSILNILSNLDESKLEKLSIAAKNKAKVYNWAKFRYSIQIAFKKIIYE